MSDFIETPQFTEGWPSEWKRQMEDVNASVNALPYTGDAEKYNVPDFWRSIDEAGTGDCEDYAIGKLRRLVMLVWRVSTLHLACCYVETGEYHAVLVVETPEGSRMLDNRQERPVALEALSMIGYRPERIQAIGGAREWRSWVAA